MIEVKIDTEKLILEIYVNGSPYYRLTGDAKDGPMTVIFKEITVNQYCSGDKTNYVVGKCASSVSNCDVVIGYEKNE